MRERARRDLRSNPELARADDAPATSDAPPPTEPSSCDRSACLARQTDEPCDVVLPYGPRDGVRRCRPSSRPRERADADDAEPRREPPPDDADDAEPPRGPLRDDACGGGPKRGPQHDAHDADDAEPQREPQHGGDADAEPTRGPQRDAFADEEPLPEPKPVCAFADETKP